MAPSALFQQPNFPFQRPYLPILYILLFLSFERQPRIVHALVGQKGRGERLEKRAAVGTVETWSGVVGLLAEDTGCGEVAEM